MTTSHNSIISLFSWNVNGLRAVINKNALEPLIAAQNPDILCLQETKAKPGQANPDLEDYEEFYNSADRPGYSGTAIFTKLKPLQIWPGFTDDFNISRPWANDLYGDPTREGRILTAEFDRFYLVNVYTPNSKRELTRLPLREALWDPTFLEYLKDLEKHKPVVVCGDFNAAHTEIDLARPKDNEHNAGYTKEERQGIENLIQAGFIDTFRALHPADRRYTWWTWRARARERNVGWRIDYFFISKSLEKNLRSAEIHENVLGSDHCPVSITLEFPENAKN